MAELGTLIVPVRATSDEYAQDIKDIQQSTRALEKEANAILATWGKTGDEAKAAINKMDEAARSSDVKDAFREIESITGRISKSFGKLGEQQPGQKIEWDMHRASLAARTLEQLIGIHLPRAADNLISRSKTLGPVLAGAFETIGIAGGAIYILKEIPAVFEKIKEAVTGWDEAARKAFEHQIELNREYLELSREVRNAEIQREVAAGHLTAVEGLRKQIDDTQELHDKQQAIITGTNKEILARKELNEKLTSYLGIAGMAVAKVVDLNRKESLGELQKSYENASASAEKYGQQLTKLTNIDMPALLEQTRNLAMETDQWFRSAGESVVMRLLTAQNQAVAIQRATQSELIAAEKLRIDQTVLENTKLSRTLLGIEQDTSDELLQVEQDRIDQEYALQQESIRKRLGLAERLVQLGGEQESRGLEMRRALLAERAILDAKYGQDSIEITNRRIKRETAAQSAFNDWSLQAQEVVSGARIAREKQEANQRVAIAQAAIAANQQLAEIQATGNARIADSLDEIRLKQAQLSDMTAPEKVQAELNARLRALDTERQKQDELYANAIRANDEKRVLAESNKNLTADQLQLELLALEAEKRRLDQERGISVELQKSSVALAQLDAQLQNQARQRAIVESIADSITNMFTESLVHGKSFWDAFGELGKNTFASIAMTGLNAMIKGFFDPMKEIFDGFIEETKKSFQALGKSLFDALKGGSSIISKLFSGTGGIGAAFGGLIGGATGGLKGGIMGTLLGSVGGQALGGLWQQLSTSFVGPKQFQGLTGAFKAMFAAVDPLTAVLAGASIGFNLLSDAIGKGRKEADRFVQNIQNPFGDSIIGIYQSLDRANAMGKLTVSQVESAREQIEQLWDEFVRQAQRAKYNVGAQALAAMGPIMDQWRAGLDEMEASVKQTEADAKAAADALEEFNRQQERVADIMHRVTQPFGFDPEAYEAAVTSLLSSGVSVQHIVDALGPDIASMVDTLQELGLTIPATVGALADLVRLTRRLADINTELDGVYSDLGGALNAYVDDLDSQISENQSNIEDWKGQIEDLDKSILENTAHLNDAAYWQGVYDDAVKESLDRVESLAKERQDLEEKIRDESNNIERERLQGIIDTTSDLGEYYRAQKDLADLEKRIKEEDLKTRKEDLATMQERLKEVIKLQGEAEQAYAEASVEAQAYVENLKQETRDKIDTDIKTRDALQANIDAATLWIGKLQEEKDKTLAFMDALGIRRVDENTQLAQSIANLINRGIALENERNAIIAVTGATETMTNRFKDAMDVIRRMPAPGVVSLPSYQHGVVRVPRTAPALLHEGERVVPANQNYPSIIVNIPGPVYGSKDFARWIATAVHEEQVKAVKHGGAKSATTEVGSRSNRF